MNWLHISQKGFSTHPHLFQDHRTDTYVLDSEKKRILLMQLINNGGIRFFLDLYLTSKITPRGLRNLKPCTFLGSELTKEWSAIAEFCTQKWMEILIKQRDTRYNILLSRIPDLIEALKSEITSLPTSWLRRIKLNTKFHEDCLIKTKLQKIYVEILMTTTPIGCSVGKKTD